MIFELIVRAVVGLARFVVGLFPTSTPPAWAVSAGETFGSITGTLTGFGSWLPIGLLFTVPAVVLACWGIGFVIKIVRIVASFITLGGGSAA